MKKRVQLGDELRIVVPRLLDRSPSVKMLWDLREVERKLTTYFGSFVRVGEEEEEGAVAIYDVPATGYPFADNFALRQIGQSVILALGIDGVYTRGADGTVRIVTRPKAPTIQVDV